MSTSRKWGSVPALVLLLAPLAAHAVFGTSFEVQVRDAETGKPLDGAFVIARDFATVGKLHGTETRCVRGDVVPAAAQKTTVALPGAGLDSLTRARGMDVIAYRPGYCLARTADAARLSSHRYLPMGSAPPPNVLEPSSETRLALQRSTQAPEERIRYLSEAAFALSCAPDRWSDRSGPALAALQAAMVGEARGVARTRYEKALADQLEQRLALVRSHGVPAHGMLSEPVVNAFGRDFLVGPPEMRVSWRDPQPLGVVALQGSSLQAASPGRPAVAAAVQPTVIAATPLQAQQPIAVQAARPGNPAQGTAPAPGNAVGVVGGAVASPHPALSTGLRPPPGLVIHCRHGAPSACDLDERDYAGQTALYAAATAGRVEEARLLLEAGADPNIARMPGAPTAIEKALETVLRGYSSPERHLQVVDLLAADPRTTLPAALKADLTADPATWTQFAHSKNLAAVVARREALARLPARPQARPGCEEPGYGGYRYTDPMLRLRPGV